MLGIRGFYRHYKHDPYGPLENATYEMLGLGVTPADKMLMVYRSLYAPEAGQAPRDFSLRPIEMFREMVMWEGRWVPRFYKVTEPEALRKLVVVRDNLKPQTHLAGLYLVGKLGREVVEEPLPYEVLGVGVHTESSDLFAVSRPLFKSGNAPTQRNFYLAPYQKFQIDFHRVAAGSNEYESLATIRDAMYPAVPK